MKDHELANLTNDLRYIAIKYGNTEQLREQIAHKLHPKINQLRAELAAKTQECQELRKDAERYRHFRKAIMSEETSLLNEDEFDAAIDTAIKEAK